MNANFISSLKDIAIQAGQISIDLRDEGLVIDNKKDNSPVTNADIAISNFIYSGLTSIDKNIPIICEEQYIQDISKQQMFWLVDPIDGTRSYIKNMDSFTVNIALIEFGVPVIGIVYQPTSKKLYFTDYDGSFVVEQNGNKIIPIKRENDGCIAVVSSRNFNQNTEDYIKDNNFSEVIAIPSSIKLCMIAEGSGDVYPKFGPTMEWDIAAGHALINATGGVVVDNETREVLLYGKPGFQNPDFIAFGSSVNKIY